MTAMLLAYANRDSVEFAKVFHPSYLGVSTDLTQPQVTTDSLSWDDEMRHIGRLRREIEVTDIEIDFGPTTTWQVYPAPEEGYPDAVGMTVFNVLIQLFTSSGGYEVSRDGGVLSYEYKLTPTVSPTGTTWSIIRWTEYRQGTT